MKVHIKCSACGTIHKIDPPKRKLKKAYTIELTCDCGHKDEYFYIHNLNEGKK